MRMYHIKEVPNLMTKAKGMFLSVMTKHIGKFTNNWWWRWAKTTKDAKHARFVWFNKWGTLNFSFGGCQTNYIWKNNTEWEIKAIEWSQTWKLIELPKIKQHIIVKWTYKKKMNAQVEIEWYMARLVAKRYKKKTRINYDEVFASITRIKKIRIFIAQIAQFKW